MKCYFSIYILVVSLYLASCKSSKSNSPVTLTSLYHGEAFIVWNEDTVHSYQIALSKKKKFLYTIVTKDGLKKSEEYYKGTFKLSKDTFFLTYYKDRQPEGVTNYLIVEVSGNYLIQPFVNTNRRIFLRVQRFRHLL